jgi:hypothetical protein
MSKFNEAIRKYITEQGVETPPFTINTQALGKTSLPKNNPELLKIADILKTLTNNIDPNSNIEDIISTITTLTPENKIKLEAKLKENGLSLQALDPKNQQTQTTTQNPNQQATPQQPSTPKAPQSAYSSMPKA